MPPCFNGGRDGKLKKSSQKEKAAAQNTAGKARTRLRAGFKLRCLSGIKNNHIGYYTRFLRNCPYKRRLSLTGLLS
jgi:hypothetical protein